MHPCGAWVVYSVLARAESFMSLKPVGAHAGDVLQFGAPDTAEKYKVKMYHRNERERLERAFSLSDANGSEPGAATKEAAMASSS